MHWQFKETAVQNQVAANITNASHADLAQEQPEILCHQSGIAAALDDQVAMQHIACMHALEIGMRLPAKCRPEQFQRSLRRHQFHC